MNEPEDTTPDSSELTELRTECEQLRKQATNMLIALVVISGTLAAFLFLQVWRTGKDTDTLREQQTEYAQRAQREQLFIHSLVPKLAEYGKTHPDFKPIMDKYGIGVTSAVPPVVSPPPQQ